MTTVDYLAQIETMRRRELLHGVVREPPAPRWGHQTIVTGVTAHLSMYVRREGLGKVCVSPIDVILDAERALIVQPDVIFVSTARLGIIRGQVWGAPDLVVEVLSRGTRRYDRTAKLEWYAKYGVRECWLVDPQECRIEVVVFSAEGLERTTFEARDVLRSTVLPGLRLGADDAFSW